MEFSLNKKPSSKTKHTAKFTLALDALCKDPEHPVMLEVRHAGAGNQAFQALAFKRANANGGRSGKVTSATIQVIREQDAEIFARTVLVGWENVYAAGGDPAPFDAETAEKFLLCWVQPRQQGEEDADYAERLAEFDRFRGFCFSVDSFRDPVGSAEDLGKG